jgi:hypothetical protein
MSRLLFLLSLLSGSLLSHAQANYFQQYVDYDIEVSLDDSQHMLHGFETLIYTNHSKDTLRHIYMHLWPNAFKNDHSSYTAQSVENGETRFYYSQEDERGYIDSLYFKVNHESVNSSNYNEHEDIIVLELNEPLLPEKSIEISTPFRVKIPATFSRLGHQVQAYQITQWYPKPAVYDRNGWHPMPYLDQGEFYSEFGNYKVTITIPANYVVAATGDLQEESEKQFIASKIKEDPLKNVASKDSPMVNKYPYTIPKDTSITSSSRLKTISFTQSNVHDFAWFADKSFQVEKTELQLPSGKKIDCSCYIYLFQSRREIFNS